MFPLRFAYECYVVYLYVYLTCPPPFQAVELADCLALGLMVADKVLVLLWTERSDLFTAALDSEQQRWEECRCPDSTVL